MSSNRFILAATCILVKGFKRTILADLHRSNFWVFDNPIKSWLTGINESEISSLSKEDLSLFNELNKEEVFIRIPVNIQDSFTDLPMNFYNSTLLNNCILELSKLTVDKIDRIIYSLNTLGCKFIEIRCNEDIDPHTQ